MQPGEWFDPWTGTTVTGPKTISVQAGIEETPMWIRAGSILPLIEPSHQPLDEAVDPTVLDIYPDAKGRAKGRWYADDGNSRGYESGQFRWTEVSFDGKALTFESRGEFPATDREITVRINGQSGSMAKLGGNLVHEGAAMPILRPGTVTKTLKVQLPGQTLARGGRIVLKMP